MQRWSNGLLALGAILAMSAGTLSRADGAVAPKSYDPATVESWWQSFAPASAADIAALGEWKPEVARRINLAELYAPTPQQVAAALDEAIRLGMSSLEFFSDPAWCGSRAVLMSKDLLAGTHQAFTMHAIFEMAIKDVDDKPVTMEWLILGQSQLIIKYDRSCTIAHPDYDIYTGKYEYYRFFRMNVGKDRDGQRGVFRIKGANAPGDDMDWMVGPMNAAIKNFFIDQGKLRCDYRKVMSSAEKVALIPIERVKPPDGPPKTPSKQG